MTNDDFIYRYAGNKCCRVGCDNNGDVEFECETGLDIDVDGTMMICNTHRYEMSVIMKRLEKMTFYGNGKYTDGDKVESFNGPLNLKMIVYEGGFETHGIIYDSNNIRTINPVCHVKICESGAIFKFPYTCLTTKLRGYRIPLYGENLMKAVDMFRCSNNDPVKEI